LTRLQPHRRAFIRRFTQIVAESDKERIWAHEVHRAAKWPCIRFHEARCSGGCVNRRIKATGARRGERLYNLRFPFSRCFVPAAP